MNEIDEKRKERRRNLELVMFPASKNFEPAPETNLDDPLEELLQEFAEFEDEDAELEEKPEVAELCERNDELLLQLGSRSGHQDYSSRDILGEQAQLLRETQQRLKYYLDEIDSVLPTR